MCACFHSLSYTTGRCFITQLSLQHAFTGTLSVALCKTLSLFAAGFDSFTALEIARSICRCDLVFKARRQHAQRGETAGWAAPGCEGQEAERMGASPMGTEWWDGGWL